MTDFVLPMLPRYTDAPFPPYRFLPFQPGIPHPRYDPDGHSYGKEEEYLASFSAADWNTCQPYLYGIDLFNYGYWWEAHESLESVWLAAGQKTPTGNFVQGIILLAAAQLKRFMQEIGSAKLLTDSATEKLSSHQGIYLGIEISPLLTEAKRCLAENCGEFPQIRLTHYSR